MRPNETNMTKVKTNYGNGNQNYQTKSDIIGSTKTNQDPSRPTKNHIQKSTKINHLKTRLAKINPENPQIQPNQQEATRINKDK